MKELALSIKEHGVIQPIIVRNVNGKYEIIETEYIEDQNAIVFKTDSFSNYAIATKMNTEKSDETSGNPKTGDNIFINIAIFLLELFNPGIEESFAVWNIGIIKFNQFYRLFTGMFLHANIWHLLTNMYALYVIGSQLEGFIGRAKYLTVYIISGIMGSLLSVALHSGNFAAVGASGAIFGLLGSILYFGYHYRIYLGQTLRSQIIPLILLNLFIGFVLSGVDNAAHIGGLIGGILIEKMFNIRYLLFFVLHGS